MQDSKLSSTGTETFHDDEKKWWCQVNRTPNVEYKDEENEPE